MNELLKRVLLSEKVKSPLLTDSQVFSLFQQQQSGFLCTFTHLCDMHHVHTYCALYTNAYKQEALSYSIVHSS